MSVPAWVVPLSRVTRADIGTVGGKGANLGELLLRRFPVPAGFCVTTEAWSRFVGGALDEFAAALRSLAPEDAAAVQRLGAQVRARLSALPVPGEIESQIRQAAAGIGAQAWAVRSSATAEDLADASFAGQQDTYLDVETAALGEKVRDCWVSLYSDRAIAYRARRRIADERVRMAVVVQRLVRADAAGVLFTVDPVSGAADRLVVEASPGPGEAVVSGRVSPDRLVLAKPDARVLQCVPSRAGAAPCLADEVAARLGRIALRIEEEFGAPQDIEWAVAQDEVHILQSRPVTTLGSRPAVEGPDDEAPRIVWTNANVGELLPEAATPMTWHHAREFVKLLFDPLLERLAIGVQTDRLLGLFAGRIYFNLNTLAAMFRRFPGLGRVQIGRLLGGAQTRLAGAKNLELRRQDLPDVRVSPLRTLVRVPSFLVWFLLLRREQGERLLEQYRAETERLSNLELATRSDAQLHRLWDGALRAPGSLLAAFCLAARGIAFSNVLQTLCAKWLGDAEGSLAGRLLAGLGGMDSAEAGFGVYRLARLAASLPAIRDAVAAGGSFAETKQRLQSVPAGIRFLGEWDEFARRHGHHARGEIDIAIPRWAEAPDEILVTVRAYLARMDVDPLEAHARRMKEREALVAESLSRLGPLRRRVFSLVLSRAAEGLVMRENFKSEAVRRLAFSRRVLLEAGERLVRRGLVRLREDVFFLEPDELQRALDGDGRVLADVVARRREEHERNRARTPPPVFVGRLEDGAALADEAPGDGKCLRGLGASPGVVRGRARVILHAGGDERLEPGEILVAPFTDPGWTPFFLTAGGIVMDLGGLLSHGAIVAREYGIPAVVNVGPATRIVRTGQLLELDGNRGEVRLLD